MRGGLSRLATGLFARSLVPERVIQARLQALTSAGARGQRAREAEGAARRREIVERRRTGPIAVRTRANESPDDLPQTFYRALLGGQLKYSVAFWENSL